MRPRQIGLLLLLALAIGVFVALDLGSFLSFEQLKASQASFAQLHAAQPLMVAVVSPPASTRTCSARSLNP